ncbi:hypothetical protein C8Q76DRAFT_59317 [Earliella scabrosa]|nr:hypothetical protein C8Q76DRAFT_59317 [Earliella scabrosa]
MANGFECYECRQVFARRGERKKHGMTGGHQWMDIPPKKKKHTFSTPLKDTGGQAEPRRFLFCPECSITFNTLESFNSHNRSVHATASSSSQTVVHQDDINEMEPIDMLNGRFPICPVCRCHYQDRDVLLKHLKSYTNCECGVHILPSWNLEAHYATSDPHPKCERCGYGFKDEEEYHLHLYDCFRERPEDTKEDPQPEPSPALNSTSLLPDEAPLVVHEDLHHQPSEDTGALHSPIAPHTDSNDSLAVHLNASPTENLARDAGDLQTMGSADKPGPLMSTPDGDTPRDMSTSDGTEVRSMSKRRSASSVKHELSPPLTEKQRRTTLTSNMTEDLSNSSRSSTSGRVPTPPLVSNSGACTPRISSFYAPPMHPRPSPSPAVSTWTVEQGRSREEFRAGQQGGANRVSQPVQRSNGSLSWHCRACFKDPCDEPVATMCGHIFCHRCIVREIERSPCCPVCAKVLFVRLDA